MTEEIKEIMRTCQDAEDLTVRQLKLIQRNNEQVNLANSLPREAWYLWSYQTKEWLWMPREESMLSDSQYIYNTEPSPTLEELQAGSLPRQIMGLMSKIKSYLDLSKYEESLLSEYNTKFIKDKIQYIDGKPINLEFWNWRKGKWEACITSRGYNPTYWIYRIKKEPTVLFAGTPGGSGKLLIKDFDLEADRLRYITMWIQETGKAEPKFKVGDKVRLKEAFQLSPEQITLPVGTEGVVESISASGTCTLKFGQYYLPLSTCWFEPVPEPTYAERQDKWVKDHNVKVGDMVKITRCWNVNEESYQYSVVGKTELIGETLPIRRIDVDTIVCGIPRVTLYFPYFALELIEEPIETYKSNYEKRMAECVSKINESLPADLLKRIDELKMRRPVRGEYYTADEKLLIRMYNDVYVKPYIQYVDGKAINLQYYEYWRQCFSRDKWFVNRGNCIYRIHPVMDTRKPIDAQETMTFFQVTDKQPPIGMPLYLNPHSLILHSTGAAFVQMPENWHLYQAEWEFCKMLVIRQEDGYYVDVTTCRKKLIKYSDAQRGYVVSKLIGLDGIQHTAVLDKKNIFQSVVDYLRRFNEAKR